MKNKVTKILTVVVCVVGCVASTAAMPAYADLTLKDVNVCDQIDKNKNPAAYEFNGCEGSSDELTTVVQNILNAVIFVSGLVAVVFVIMGGVQYMTSAGDPAKAKKAKDTILYACIGLVICALAFVIVNWTISIINEATG